MQPARSISVILVQAWIKLNTKHLYQLDAADNSPLGIITLAADHKINHKYPKLLKIPLLNMEHNTVQIARRTVRGKLQPLDVTDLEVINILCTIDVTASTTGTHTELPCMPPKSSFQPEQSNIKQSIVLENAHILQDAKDGPAFLLEG